MWLLDRLIDWLTNHRTVSSLLHSDASPAAFGAPLWWCGLSVMAATFCSSLHTCSRYFLRICRYELKALLEWKKPTKISDYHLMKKDTTELLVFRFGCRCWTNMPSVKHLSCGTWYLLVSLCEPSYLLSIVSPVRRIVWQSCVEWILD